MFEYRRVRTMFPVRVSRNTKVHLTSVSNYCLGYLSANRDRAPVTLTRGLRKLVSAVTAHHHPELIDSIAVSPSCFGVHVLAEVAATRPAVLDGAAVDELFRRKHWRDGGDVYVDSLTIVAAALSERHENVWRLVNGWMPFMEAAATSTVGDDDRRARFRRTLMVNVRCTPLAALTYDLEPQDPGRDREFDWLDPRQRLVLSFALSAGTGAKWLHQTGAFDSLDGHVKTLLDGTVENPSPDPQGFNPQTSVNAIVDTAYSFCASFEGMFFCFVFYFGLIHTELLEINLFSIHYRPFHVESFLSRMDCHERRY
ncbi:Hypothetical protein CINCED_3A012085 [Cinara cedri]|uniref:Uncharacterized protein n=1 Tax=Cinara cedri TaxID=506608 RepID=A0A5E4M321_9HEMI|nr:Hypothetical protein CINCED_3A012085 [Cinara cedri]